MKGKHFGLRALTVLLALALLTPVSAALAAKPKVVRSPQRLTVDGQNVACEKYNIDDYNYFKLRDLACLFSGTGSQFYVEYDVAKRTVSVVTGAPYTKRPGDLELGADKSATADRSTQPILIDGVLRDDLSAFNIGDNNYFKLQDLAPVIGFEFDYDLASNTTQIFTRPKQGGGQTGSARLGLTEDAGRDYLNRIVFLGDSTTYGIGYYYRQGYTELCPPSQVWTPASGTLTLSYYSIATVVYPETQEELPIAEAVARAKPDILFITLGVNGISFMDEEWFIRDYTALVRMVQEASPETKIILNSIYPVADSYAYQKDINNQKINAANGWIERIAADTGCRFLYSWEALAVNGKLPERSQNGDGLHLNGEAFTTVMQYIRTHAYL